MGGKAEETTRNINNAFGPVTANECTEQWWFKKFCKGDKSLEGDKKSGQLWEVDNNQLTAIIEADHLTTTQDTAQELNVDQSTVIWDLMQTGKVKKLKKRVPQELTTNQKKIITFKCCLLLFYATMNHFSTWLWGVMKSGFLYNQQQTGQWLDREAAPKHFPKPNLHQKRVMVTVWWSAGGLIHYSFLNHSGTITSEKYAQ